jgi:peptide/nickel transport system substrate-binding protein
MLRRTGLAVLLALAACKRTPPPSRPAGPPIADAAFLEGAWSPTLLDGTPRPGGTLTVRLPLEPPSLNRIIDSDLWLSRMTRPAVYETLMRIDGEDQPHYPLKPALALDAEVSADHLTYTFHLRRGVFFHNGQPFSAHDVVATFNKLMDPKVKGQSMRSTVEGLSTWKAVGEDTVVFTFKEPHYLALRQLATSVPILPAGQIEKLTAEEFNGPAPINRAPIGTGPWKFESWETGRAISFVGNAGYWDEARRPHLERLVFRVVVDSTIAYELMRKGEIDVLNNIQPKQWIHMGEDPAVFTAFHRFRYFTNNYGFVAWNEKRPFFADKRVRLALAELFDQDSFNENIAYGLELRTECVFFEASDACDPALKPVAYNLEHAKQLLAEAGWTDSDGDGVLDKDGVKFSFRLSLPPNNDKLNDMAAVLSEAYRKAGIDMQFKNDEWTVLIKRLREHDFDAATLVWGLPDIEGDPYQVWHSSQAKGGSNWVSFDDPKADRLIEQGRREFDPAKRTQLWRALGHELREQEPYLMLTVRPELEAVRKDFRGVKPSMTYYDFARWWRTE